MTKHAYSKYKKGLVQTDSTNGSNVVYIIPVCNKCFEKTHTIGNKHFTMAEFNVETLII